MGTSKLKLQKMWNEYFLKKGNVYPVLLELEWECQIGIINKPRISVAFVQGIYHICYFFCKKGN